MRCILQVEIVGVTGELKAKAEAVLTTKPAFAYTLSEVKQDVRRVFNTGWFRECVPDAVDTRDGVKLVIRVRAGGGGRLSGGGYSGVVK